MPISWLEILGYAASVITAVSLMMASHVRLRIVNLIGASTFAAYGFLISAYPVGVMNAFVACIDIYFLYKIMRSKVLFTLLPMPASDVYFRKFLDFYQKDITRFFPDFAFSSPLMAGSFDELAGDRVCLYILRNMVTAGVFTARRDPEDPSALQVELDYVVPEFRDYRTGSFLFKEQAGFFRGIGIRRIIADTGSPAHARYLEHVGFQAAAGLQEGKASRFELDLD